MSLQPLIKVLLPFLLLSGLAIADPGSRESYFSDYPATYYGKVAIPPDNDQCRDREHLHLGQPVLVTPYDSEYATPKDVNCLDGTTFGIWYSVRGDGTDFNISTCLFNVTDEENTAPVIATVEVYTDTTCENGFPCGPQCSYLECVQTNNSFRVDEEEQCSLVSFRTEKGQEYILYLYFLPLEGEGGVNPPRALAKRGDLPDLLNPPVVLLVDGVGCDGSLDTHTAWDECGVCGGNSTSCRGCDGVLYSGLEFDVCGVCNGTNTTCIGGCDQQPRSNKFYDICGVCGGDGSSCAGCDGVPEPDILLRKRLDQCGVCGGDGMSCADCDGVIGGDNYPDPCGVCFGDGSTCADCAGCPNGGAVVDRCGVCNGDNACLGCDGELNGAVKDICGECGGNGTSCLGCNGIPFAVEDACGVCMGDNSSCMCQFYEEFSRPEMDCQLLHFTLNSTLEYIDYLVDVLEATLYDIKHKVTPGTLNYIIRDEILDLNGFEEGCVEGYLMELDSLVALLDEEEEGVDARAGRTPLTEREKESYLRVMQGLSQGGWQ